MTFSRSEDLSSERMPWLAVRVVMNRELPKEAPNEMAKLDGKKVAILVANEGVEQVELTEPRKALEDAGADVSLIALEKGDIQGMNHFDKGDTFQADAAVADVDTSDFDALQLPGGVGNPDQ